MTLRWTGYRKAETLIAIEREQMTEEQFCKEHDSSAEEIQSWRDDPAIAELVSKLKERAA